MKVAEREGAMKNTIKCCISCILPCGALDVVRIVHSNGHVEEISGTITASEIMKAHPKHVLKKPSSPSEEGVVPKIVVVPPDAELQRGKIYFLMPMPPPPPPPEKTTRSRSSTRKKRRDSESNTAAAAAHHRSNTTNNTISMSNLVISDRYLSEILSEKISTQRDRRRGRVGVWRPHLESISETPIDL